MDYQIDTLNSMFEKYLSCDPSMVEQNRSGYTWGNARREILRYLYTDTKSIQELAKKGQKPFVQSIIQEVKEELREDAESHVISLCKEKYSELIDMGYFKLEDQNGPHKYLMEKRDQSAEDDYLP